MALDSTYLQVSDGTQDAALMHITNSRSIGATTIQVDTVVGIPAKFIGAYGTLLPSGFIDPATMRNFYGHLSGANLEIDGFCPGSSDSANTAGQVVVIKPNTFWANFIAGFVENVGSADGTELAGDSVGNAQLQDDAVLRANLGAGALPIVFIPLTPSGFSPTASYATYDPSKTTIDFSKLVTNASAAYLRVTANNGGGGQTMNIQLVNVTDGGVITGSQVAVTAAGATESVSGDILANLPTASKLMAYQVKITSGAMAIHRIVLEIHY